MNSIKGSLLGVLGAASLLHGAPQVNAQYLRNEEHKLLAVDGTILDSFGRAVAISGAIAIVGAPNQGAGAAYLFDVSTGTPIAKLRASDGASNDNFGRSLAMSGLIAIVGAPSDDDSGPDSGSAYLFDVATHMQLAKLLANDGAFWDYFGSSVAICGPTAIVGAHADEGEAGSAYLFDVATGTQIAKLFPRDGAFGDNFGYSVAISESTAVVGAHRDNYNGEHSGSAYLFDVATATQIAKLLPDDGASFEFFGTSVAISRSTVIVGAPEDDDQGLRSGSAYLFDVTTGTQLAKLLPRDGASDDHFGESVAISGTTAVVGVPLDGSATGSAALFDAVTGAQIAKLRASDGDRNDEFGESVAISGSTAIVGAWLDDDNGFQAGSAYLFDASGSGPGITLDFSGACPGQGVFTVANATSAGNVALMYGIGDGPTTIPDNFPCAGTLLNVGPPNLNFRTVRANSNGVAVLNTTLLPVACGQVRVQALDLTTCETSNVVRP